MAKRSSKAKPKPRKFLRLDESRRANLLHRGIADDVLKEIEALTTDLVELETLIDREPAPSEIITQLDELEAPAKRLADALSEPLAKHRTLSFLRQHGAEGLGPPHAGRGLPLWEDLQRLLQAIGRVRTMASAWRAPTVAEFPRAMARVVRRVLVKHDMIFAGRRGHAAAILGAFLAQAGMERADPRNYIRDVIAEGSG